MDVQDLIKKIEEERKSLKEDIYSSEGMLRLQKTAEEYYGEYRLIWSDDLAKEMQDRPEPKSYNTKVKKLDSLLGGFCPQQLISLTAGTKQGKTAFSLFLIESMEELNPLMIPLEQSNEEIIRQRTFNGYSIPRFLSPYKLAAFTPVEWVELRLVEGIAKYNTKMLVIDHLGYIDDQGKDGKYRRENHAYRIEKVMQELKNLAKKWNVVIVLLVHISQKDEGSPPTLADIKGSSSIAQESDVVLSLWRESKKDDKVRVYSNYTLVSVMANRRTGKNGNFGLEFDTKTGRYEETKGADTWIESLEASANEYFATEESFRGP